VGGGAEFWTISVTGVEVLAAKFVSPSYEAVRLWLPDDSDEVLNIALPALLRVPVPKTVAPSRKVTVPVGVPAPGAPPPTFAVSITGCPRIDGLGDADTVVVV